MKRIAKDVKKQQIDYSDSSDSDEDICVNHENIPIEPLSVVFLNEIEKKYSSNDKEELLKLASNTIHIKTFGVLKEKDSLLNLSLIKYKGYSLIVDFSLYNNIVPFSIGSFHEFIGELVYISSIGSEFIDRIVQFIEKYDISTENNNINHDSILIETVVMRARLFKDIDTIDVNLFESSYNLKRKFESFLDTI